MSSYHGWTHAPKADGGTDPIPGGAGAQWARRRQLNDTDQVIASGSPGSNVTLTEFLTSDATSFEAYDSGSIDGIKILADALYSINFRMTWDDWPGDHVFWIEGIDDPAFSVWPHPFGFVDVAGIDVASSAGSFTARLAVDQIIYMIALHNFGSDRSLEGFGAGTYMEIIKHAGSIDMTERRG